MTGAVAAVIGTLPAVKVTAFPGGASGTGDTSSIISLFVTISVEGGTPSQYSWVKLSGGEISPLNPSSASTAFIATGMAPSETRTASFVCEVLVNGAIYQSPEVVVTLERY